MPATLGRGTALRCSNAFPMSAALLWFRRDLRLADNPALAAALKTRLPIVCVHVDAPEESAPWSPGSASRWWLERSLAALDASLAARGNALVRRAGPSLAALEALAAETGATHLFFNRCHEPAGIARDDAIVRALAGRLEIARSEAALLCDPDRIATADGRPYRVFTPFWRNARRGLLAASLAPEPAPDRIPARERGVLRERVAERDDPERPGFDDAWLPGEAGAAAALDEFVTHALARYPTERDFPAVDGTSRLSPHLAFGEIGPRTILAAIARHGGLERHEKFVQELGWREFAHYVLRHFPQSAQAPLDARFERFPWANDAGAAFAAWQAGRTGIPFVDAGMRQLAATGWMPNRLRMVVASFLTKNLRIHWLAGARHFWESLVDADLSNNTLGWQWVAGCGADAAPYFRIFNPVTQGVRHDRDGAYVRRWVPELARIPAAAVHAPWLLPPDERARFGLGGTCYERGIVDLAASRAAALGAWARMRAACSRHRPALAACR